MRRHGLRETGLAAPGCDWKTRLIGSPLPDLGLALVAGESLSLASIAQSFSLVVFFCPGNEDGRRVADTLRVLRWSQHCEDLVARGYRVVAVSTRPVGEQSRQVQGKLAARNELGYYFVSDGDPRLAQALGLPTVDVAGAREYGRLTLVARDGRVARVWFPADPVHDASTVSGWIRRTDG